MRNSFFFSEAQIVANYAIKHSDPLGRGIEMGIRHLKQKRYDPDDALFVESRFSMYAEHYAKLAKAMVHEYQLYQKAVDAGVFEREPV